MVRFLLALALLIAAPAFGQGALLGVEKSNDGLIYRFRDGDSIKVGELVENVVTALTNAASTSNYLPLASVKLTPGVWDLSATAQLYRNGATLGASNSREIAISSTSASDAGAANGHDYFLDESQIASGANFLVLAIPFRRYVVTSNTTYFLNVRVSFSAGTPQWRGALSARRVK